VKRVKNKVLIKVSVPELDYETDIFVPVNEVLWKIKTLIVMAISDISGGALNKNGHYSLINKETGQVYNQNSILIDTDIRNATELILISSVQI
jgi:hypothetical protein